MDSEQELARLRDQMTAVRAVATMDQPDHAARCDAAASALRRLLELPERRPGAWESQHVSALEGELHGVLDELTGAGGSQ